MQGLQEGGGGGEMPPTARRTERSGGQKGALWLEAASGRQGRKSGHTLKGQPRFLLFVHR